MRAFVKKRTARFSTTVTRVNYNTFSWYIAQQSIAAKHPVILNFVYAVLHIRTLQ